MASGNPYLKRVQGYFGNVIRVRLRIPFFYLGARLPPGCGFRFTQMSLYSRIAVIDQHVEQLLTAHVGELLRAPQNQEVSIHRGGKVYVDSAKGCVIRASA